MSSVMASRSSTLFFFASLPSLPPRPSAASVDFPPLSSFISFPTKRAEERLSNPRLSPLGLCGKNSKRGSNGGGDCGRGSRDLEDEVLEFMEGTHNPQYFPTREELIAGGRADLAEAVAKEGGWMTYGWNLGEQEEVQEDEDEGIGPSRDSASMETGAEEETGVEGILSRLERERSLSFGVDSGQKQVNGEKSLGSGLHEVLDSGDAFVNEGDTGSGDSNSRSMSPGIDGNLFHNTERIHSRRETSTDGGGMSLPSDLWKNESLKRTGHPIVEFKAAEIVPIDEMKKVGHKSDVDVSVDENEVADNECKIGQENEGLQIHMRLQQLESELTASLNLFHSRSSTDISYKDHKSSVDDLLGISDDLEFKETEIMNAKIKLRSMKAKLEVLEHKMSFELIEKQKLIDVMNRRIDAAKKAVDLLRAVCIVWPTSASKVILVGSFDGWTNQRKMERSKTGIFTLNLKLYPGRYEIKFIVDGVWMVDPLRPIVHNNGYENNLLVIS